MTITVKGNSGNLYPDLPVYAFTVTPADPTSGSTEPVVTYSGYNGKTDASGQVILTLPAGDYRFRSDLDGVQFWSDTEKACSVLSTTTPETPGCQTAEVVLPGGTGKINVTIDYEYDDLNRITSAIYTDAENTSAAATSFTYSYDAAGNVEEYVSVIAGQTVTTTYRYNEANELVSATRNNVVWVYEYDGNGALLSTQPESGLANGSKKYSYNTAGYLTKVEAYTGTAWYTQAEMSYTGVGDRLSMTGSTEDGQSVSTTYALSNGTVLLANASGKVTAYLYGNGAIGEQTDAWSYALIDGTGTPRQMVDQDAKVTALASYTPWGDVLNSGGTGSFSTGYFGGMMDAATGLIYVGNGQYYDPLTGRFINRENRIATTIPDSHSKSNVLLALLSPMLLLTLNNRKRRTYIINICMISIIIVGVFGFNFGFQNVTPVNAMGFDNTNPPPDPPVKIGIRGYSFITSAISSGAILQPEEPISNPIYECKNHSKNDQDTPKHLTILVCGYGQNCNEKTNTYTTLKPYAEKAREKGDVIAYTVVYKDPLNSKTQVATKIILQLFNHPDATVIGHSAGADATILAMYFLRHGFEAYSQARFVVMDPSLSAVMRGTARGIYAETKLAMQNARNQTFFVASEQIYNYGEEGDYIIHKDDVDKSGFIINSEGESNGYIFDEYDDIKSILGSNYYQPGIQEHIALSNDESTASSVFSFLGW